jgi:hypothetical protein
VRSVTSEAIAALSVVLPKGATQLMAHVPAVTAAGFDTPFRPCQYT